MFGTICIIGILRIYFYFLEKKDFDSLLIFHIIYHSLIIWYVYNKYDFFKISIYRTDSVDHWWWIHELNLFLIQKRILLWMAIDKEYELQFGIFSHQVIAFFMWRSHKKISIAHICTSNNIFSTLMQSRSRKNLRCIIFISVTASADTRAVIKNVSRQDPCSCHETN